MTAGKKSHPEFSKFDKLSDSDRKKYSSETEDYINDIESRILSVFRSYSHPEVGEFIIERIRDGAYNAYEDSMERYRAVIMRMAYKSGETVLKEIDRNTDDENNALIKNIISTIKKNKKDRENAVKDDEFMAYMRGYSKYWNNRIDENDADIPKEGNELFVDEKE